MKHRPTHPTPTHTHVHAPPPPVFCHLMIPRLRRERSHCREEEIPDACLDSMTTERSGTPLCYIWWTFCLSCSLCAILAFSHSFWFFRYAWPLSPVHMHCLYWRKTKKQTSCVLATTDFWLPLKVKAGSSIYSQKRFCSRRERGRVWFQWQIQRQNKDFWCAYMKYS